MGTSWSWITINLFLSRSRLHPLHTIFEKQPISTKKKYEVGKAMPFSFSMNLQIWETKQAGDIYLTIIVTNAQLGVIQNLTF